MGFSDDMRDEAERQRRRFVHATRPRHPLSLQEAAELCARMAGDPAPEVFAEVALHGTALIETDPATGEVRLIPQDQWRKPAED